MTDTPNTPGRPGADAFRPCLVIPCYRHAARLAEILPRAAGFGAPVIVADDGNAPADAELLRGITAAAGAVLVRHERNLGKGRAVESALRRAAELGFTHALQVDADGQHDLGAVPLFFAEGRRRPGVIVSGVPVYDADAPAGRKIGRYVTHFWVALELGLFRVTDTMCGMRMYPVAAALRVIDAGKVGAGMDFDTDIFVRMYWSGTDFAEIPVAVAYVPGNVSNFRVFRDNARISLMHARLCVEKILHYPSVRRRNYL